MRTVPEWFFKQSAVIPYRYRNGKYEILLITSRKGKKWVIPKGVIEPGLKAGESALKEALEEAGVEGLISRKPIGKYRYNKWSGTCKVKVFALRVTKIHEDWLEKSIRKRQWFSLKEATGQIREKKLQKLVMEIPHLSLKELINPIEEMEIQKDGFLISCHPERLDFDVIHGYLKTAYWCKGIPREVVEKSAENSLCFGVYEGEKQVGFARVLTDYARFAYLMDVFVLEEYRGRGLGKWLVESIIAHPRLRGVGKWMLATRDAHKLYEKFGFQPLADPSFIMEIRPKAAPPRRRKKPQQS